MIVPGLSVFVMGPSGTGKSHFLRTALLAEGSGAVALAPGIDEYGTYADLVELAPDKFNVRGFDSYDAMTQWLRKVYQVNRDHQKQHGTLLHKVVGLDTYTGVDFLAIVKGMQNLGISELPKGKSPEGAALYGGLRTDMERMAHEFRALRGLGMHWIATGHTQFKEGQDDSNLASIETGNKIHAPIFRGAFRDESPAAFDIVVHSARRRLQDGEIQYGLQWKSGSKKQSKSRYGDLASDAIIPNTWEAVTSAVDAALAKRKAAAAKQLGVTAA